MPLDLAALVDPKHTALVTQECQQGVIGEKSALPALAAGVARVDMIRHVAELVAAARAAGVRIIHCTAERRPDGFGANRNAGCSSTWRAPSGRSSPAPSRRRSCRRSARTATTS
jgi:nicotinamidase-related amidase